MEQKPSLMMFTVWTGFIMLAVLGSMAGLMSMLSVPGRAVVFVLATTMLVYWFVRVRDNLMYIIGVVAMGAVLVSAAPAFLTIFPETTLPIAMGAAAEGATLGGSEFLTLFAPTLIGLTIGVPLAVKFKQWQGIVMFITVSLATMFTWAFFALWVVGA